MPAGLPAYPPLVHLQCSR